MPVSIRSAIGAVALLMLASLAIPARAGDAAPPATPSPPAQAAPAPTAPPGSPTPAAVAAADKVLGDIGVKESIAMVVPGMLAELETNVTRTRPEIKESLRATLKTIQPEFDKSAREAYDAAATLLASQMSEKEIIEVASFFDSPTGKKYIATTPVFLQKLTTVTAPWRDKLSTDIVARAREEMKKKGVDF